jgi:hypothetical protein
MAHPGETPTVEFEIDVDTDVRADLAIIGQLTEKGRSRLVALIQVLPVITPPPSPPAPASTEFVSAERTFPAKKQ